MSQHSCIASSCISSISLFLIVISTKREEDLLLQLLAAYNGFRVLDEKQIKSFSSLTVITSLFHDKKTTSHLFVVTPTQSKCTR